MNKKEALAFEDACPAMHFGYGQWGGLIRVMLRLAWSAGVKYGRSQGDNK